MCKSIGLLEKDYFGLQYRDKNGDHLWVNLRNPLHEQVPHGPRPLMEMRVKFFVQPQKLMQVVTRCAILSLFVLLLLWVRTLESPISPMWLEG